MFGIDHLHPVFVHFPIALLTLAAAVAIGWLLSGNPFPRRAATLLLVAGSLGAFAAHYTGEDMEEAFAARAAVKLLGGTHEAFGLYTLLAAAVAAGAFIAAGLAQGSADRKGLRGPDRKPATRLLCTLLALAAGALAAYTGHLGGRMTWSAELNRPAAAPAQAAPASPPAPAESP